MNEDIKEKMKITLEQNHPNAYSTIRDDLEKIHEKNVYWTDIQETDSEFYKDPIQIHISEINSRITNLENFLGANYEQDKDGNFIKNPFDLRITRTELGLMRRPIIDSHIPEFELEDTDVPSPEERLFELEQNFAQLKEEYKYLESLKGDELNDKINEIKGKLSELEQLEGQIKTDIEWREELAASRVTISGEVKETLNERLDEDFNNLYNLVKDVNTLSKDGYIIYVDKTIPGTTQNLTLHGRTDYNVIQGDTSDAQILPITPDGASNEPIRKLEISKGDAVSIKSIQGYTYESLISDSGFAEGEHESQHTPPRSVSYTLKNTEQGEIVSIKSIEGSTVQNVATSSFKDGGTTMPFLPSDGEYSILENERDGEVSLSKIKGKFVKNEILTGNTDVAEIGTKPMDTTGPITFSTATDITVNTIKGKMIENVIVGESRAESSMPVYKDLQPKDSIYIDSVEGKTVIDILATCDTTPVQNETTTFLDVKSTLLNNGIFVKEGRFRELTIYGQTMENLGLTPKDEKVTVFSNLVTPMDLLKENEQEPTEITKIIIKGKTYDNVIGNIGETEAITSSQSIMNLYDLFVNSKYGINVELDTEVQPSNINIKGGKYGSKFVELKSFYNNGEYEGVHTIQPLELKSTDTMRLFFSEHKYIVTHQDGKTDEGYLYDKEDIYFYSIDKNGDPYQLPDKTRNVYNSSKNTEDIHIREIIFNGTQEWKLKNTAQNKINTVVFNHNLGKNILAPAANNIMANFEFFSDEQNYFKKSVAGNDGTNKYEDEAISITANGDVELRISINRIGGKTLEDLYKYLEKHPLTIKYQLKYPETYKVEHSKITKKYDLNPTKYINFHVCDGYKFELVSEDSKNPCEINMTLPTYNRYPVSKAGIYTVVTKTGNYVNNIDCSVRGNYLIDVKDAIYVDTKEPEIMLLKGNLVGDTVLQTLDYDYIMTKPSYNKNKKEISLCIDDVVYKTFNKTLTSSDTIEINLNNKNIKTDSTISVIGNDDELAQLEFVYNSLHRFNADITIDSNGLMEYSVIDVLDEGKVNRSESFLAKNITIEDSGKLLFKTENMMHRPMLFKGNYLKHHFGYYFDGVKSVEKPCLLRGFTDKYRDNYNYNTGALTRYTSELVLDSTYTYELWEDKGIKVYIPTESNSWNNNRALNTILSPNADVVYINKNYIGIKTNDSIETLLEKVSKEPIEVYFALLKPLVITKEEIELLSSIELDPDYASMFEYTGNVIKVESIVPPTFRYRTRSHNYFENVNIEEKEYILTSEYTDDKGQGHISICGIPIEIDSIDKTVIDLRGQDLSESNKIIKAMGYTCVYGLSMYESNGSILYGLDDVTSIGDTGSIDIFTIGKNKINIHDIIHDKNVTIGEDLLYSTKKNSHMNIRVELSDKKDYTYSFRTLIGEGLVDIRMDGINVTDEPFKFEEGVFEIYISDTNILEIELITTEDEVIIVDMQLEEGDEVTGFESYYRSGYTIKLDEPLLSFNENCKDLLKIGTDDHIAIIERNVGRIIINNWVKDGDVYKYELGFILNEYNCNYMKNTVIQLKDNNLVIPEDIFITLDLESQPVTVIYPLDTPYKEIVAIDTLK